jgi:hypothetical protein
LQRPFTAPDHSLLKEINILPNWTVDREALIQIVQGSSLLFSIAFFDRFLSISSVQDIVWALTIAFEDFSQSPGKEWQLMRMVYFNAELCCASFGLDSLTKSNRS